MSENTCIKYKWDTSVFLFTSLTYHQLFFIANKHILNLELKTWLFFPFHYGVVLQISQSQLTE